MLSVAEYIKILTDFEFRRNIKKKKKNRDGDESCKRKKKKAFFFFYSVHNLSHRFKKKIFQARLTNYRQDKNANKKSQARVGMKVG